MKIDALITSIELQKCFKVARQTMKAAYLNKSLHIISQAIFAEDIATDVVILSAAVMMTNFVIANIAIIVGGRNQYPYCLEVTTG